jgi:hypothetical protein
MRILYAGEHWIWSGREFGVVKNAPRGRWRRLTDFCIVAELFASAM